jgi:hypothetical protein
MCWLVLHHYKIQLSLRGWETYPHVFLNKGKAIGRGTNKGTGAWDAGRLKNNIFMQKNKLGHLENWTEAVVL